MLPGDAVFPLPEPDFLWVHPLVGRRMSGASATVVEDDEGNWHHAESTAASVAFTGYVTAPSPRDLDRATAKGVALDAVALGAHGVDLKPGDWLDCTDPGVPDYLRHTYVVDQVRPNLSHQRFLLTRAQSPAPYPGV